MVSRLFYDVGDVEYWDESDSNIDEDFSVADVQNDEPKTQDIPMASQETNKDEISIIWWVASCVYVFAGNITFSTITSNHMATKVSKQSYCNKLRLTETVSLAVHSFTCLPISHTHVHKSLFTLYACVRSVLSQDCHLRDTQNLTIGLKDMEE